VEEEELEEECRKYGTDQKSKSEEVSELHGTFSSAGFR